LGPAVPIPSGGPGESSGKALQAVDDRPTRTGLGILLGFVLGGGLALLVDQIDTRIRSRREAEKAFGLPVVAEIPRARPLSPRAKEHGGTFGVDPATADAFGRLGLAVLHSPRWVLSPRSPTIANEDEEDWPAPVRLVEGPTRLVLVASPGHEDARVAVIANLAASLAASGRSVIAIDCDPERRRLAELLGGRAVQPGPAHPRPAQPGEATSREAATGRLGVRPSAVRGVWVVTPGTSAGAGHSFDGQLMRSYLEWGDIVLVDAGPILSGGEAGSWAVEADAVLIVTAVGRTTAETAALTHDHLARLQARVLGVALVDGVARITRSWPRGAPSPPSTPPRVNPTGTLPGSSSMPSQPPQGSHGQPGPTFQTPASERRNGEATTPGPSGEAVVRGESVRNGAAQASAPKPVFARPDQRGRVEPLLEVLAPEPSAPAATPRPRSRPHSERTSGDGPVWSVSRPWPWSAGDQREATSGGATSAPERESSAEHQSEG
ncbi:MAG: hypothetical protein M3O70_01225, partial [Actinomycetota bacterium]|nr:hypothetical protein [Actinomycetota bacterium]